MLIKAIIILFMLMILWNLASGLIYLVKDRGKSTRTIKSLTWRIGLSLCLFLLLFIGFVLGIITPHPIGP